MGVICHFNNTANWEKKCAVYFLNRTKCVFIFHGGHLRECHANIRVLLQIGIFPRLKTLKQVCRPVLWVSSCRKKNVAACLLCKFLVLRVFLFSTIYLPFSSLLYLLKILAIVNYATVSIFYFLIRKLLYFISTRGSPSLQDCFFLSFFSK